MNYFFSHEEHEIGNSIPSIVKLNVGGKLFITLKQNLNISGFFRSFFSREWNFGKEYIINDDQYFIDRDPKVFRHVLNYLRNRTLRDSDFSTHDEAIDFLREMNYFQIPIEEREYGTLKSLHEFEGVKCVTFPKLPESFDEYLEMKNEAIQKCYTKLERSFVYAALFGLGVVVKSVDLDVGIRCLSDSVLEKNLKKEEGPLSVNGYTLYHHTHFSVKHPEYLVFHNHDPFDPKKEITFKLIISTYSESVDHHNKKKNVFNFLINKIGYGKSENTFVSSPYLNISRGISSSGLPYVILDIEECKVEIVSMKFSPYLN